MTAIVGPFAHPVISVVIVLSIASAASAQQTDLTVHAPPTLEPIARRVGRMELASLERSLTAAGLSVPPRISVTLIPRDDARTSAIPPWIVGLASGTSHVVIFPDRVGSYPHDSLETVVRHEIVHLALNTRAAGRPLPRWFHEGTAVTVASDWSARDEMRLLLAALDPPSMADIGRLFASDAHPDTTQAYLLAAALADEIRRRHGSQVTGTIAGHVAAGLPFDAAFKAATGEAVDDAAERAWRGYRQLARWVPAITSPSAVWTVILALAIVASIVSVRRRRARRRQWAAEEDQEP
jgi:hypothetical protein